MSNQRGLNLIEVMISLAIGLFLLLAVVSIYGVTIRGSTNVLNTSRLNHDVEAVMALMVNDMRRAGYWRWATVDADVLNGNVFMQAATIAQIPTTECVLYSYDFIQDTDRNGDGVINQADSVVEAGEFFGFRRVVVGGNGRIEMRTTGTLATATSCTTNGQWEPLTNQDQLNITHLEFSFAPLPSTSPCNGLSLTATSRCLNLDTSATNSGSNFTACATGAAAGNYWAEKRVINICMQAQLIGDASVRHTIASSVEIRNNRVGKN